LTKGRIADADFYKVPVCSIAAGCRSRAVAVIIIFCCLNAAALTLRAF